MEPLDISSLIYTAGGLGLFLLGMTVMTDALRQLAGASIRGALARFTRSPLTGVLTGATSTALLQSSSATTVAAVGFVGAGLMGFESALGIVFGANLGTTVTGWLVMLVGFKLDLLDLMLPCVFVGMLVKLLTSGRSASAGLALTGFGVLFVGIDQMQTGMSSLQGMFGALDLTSDGWLDRIPLVLLGLVFSAVTQSSSAGVAAVLTAMHAEAISLTEGLALVIGMNIGTTVTAVLATIGGSPASRRTGASHFVYNVLTAVAAFVLVTPYVRLIEDIAPTTLVDDPQLVLVAFHTGFNLLGVIAVLPFTRQFAVLMTLLVPEPSASYARGLDRSLLREPVVALDALSGTLSEILRALLWQTRWLLTGQANPGAGDLTRIRQALDEATDYANTIALDTEHAQWRRLVDAFHVLDHLRRLHARCEEDAARADRARRTPLLAESHRALVESVERVEAALEESLPGEARKRAREHAEAIAGRAPEDRAAILRDVAQDALSVEEATSALQSLRWLRRVAHHIAQITVHLEQIHDGAGRESERSAPPVPTSQLD